MKKMIAVFVSFLLVLSLFAMPVSAENPDESVKRSLYNWMVEYIGYTPDYEGFSPVDITGDVNAENYRIYHLFQGMLTMIEYTRVGNRVLMFGSASNALAVAVTEEDGVVRVVSMQGAYDSGIIDDAALDKVANGHGIWVYTCGDVDQDEKVDVADVLLIKNAIMDDLKVGTEEWTGSSDLFYDVDGDGAVNVADILVVKNLIMVA